MSTFARRTEWELTQNAITRQATSLRQNGRTILDLTVSNPLQCRIPYPASEILGALSSPAGLRYDPCARGLLAAREAVRAFYAQKGVSLSPEQIFLTASTSEAYSYLFRLLGNPADTVLFPRPSYPLFQFLVDLNDLRMDFYSLVYGDDGWGLDREEFKKKNQQAVKACVLVNPNNPTGSFYRPADIRLIKDSCRENRISLICDEVFEDYVFDPSHKHESLVNNEENLTFVLGGLSKTLGMPQMKLSWIVVSGPPDLKAQALARLDVIADTYLSVNTPVQNALTTWMTLKEKIQGAILTRIRDNRSFLCRQTQRRNAGRCLEADGGWYAVLRLPAGLDEEHVVLTLLKDDGVFVHPGYFFDFDDEVHVVLSLLPPPDIFEEGVSRMLDRINAMTAD